MPRGLGNVSGRAVGCVCRPEMDVVVRPKQRPAPSGTVRWATERSLVVIGEVSRGTGTFRRALSSLFGAFRAVNEWAAARSRG
jgi:hypothetical protein